LEKLAMNSGDITARVSLGITPLWCGWFPDNRGCVVVGSDQIHIISADFREVSALDFRTYIHKTVLGSVELEIAIDTGTLPDINFTTAEFISSVEMAIACIIEGANTCVLFINTGGMILRVERLPQRIRWLKYSAVMHALLCVDVEGAIYKLDM
jgi:hypothetical protein